MRISRGRSTGRILAWIGLAVGIGGVVPAHFALAQTITVTRDQDIVNLRLGQRIRVDDGSCPAGQIKEVSGSKLTAAGVAATRKCVQRLGPKTK
jgi:hypothetical protein